MSREGMRAVAAVGTIVVAAALNVGTGVLTQHWTIAWWIFTGVVIVIGGGLQAWLTVSDQHGRAPRQKVRRTTVGGAVRQAMTLPGEQDVVHTDVAGDLSQEQDLTRRLDDA